MAVIPNVTETSQPKNVHRKYMNAATTNKEIKTSLLNSFLSIFIVFLIYKGFEKKKNKGIRVSSLGVSLYKKSSP